MLLLRDAILGFSSRVVFCPTLQQTGEAWWFSGLFSRDLGPVWREIVNEGYWLTFVRCRCNFDLSLSILNVDVLWKPLLQKGILHITEIALQCYVFSRMGRILKSVVK